MNNKFTTLHYLIAMLKLYDIKYVVASPGAQNSAFNFLVQEDGDFMCQSVIDERSAAYVGLGISKEIDSPVVLSCTGATASRNYISALTEAYYSKTPLIALTFFPYKNTSYNLAPQYVNRTISQSDIKEVSVELPQIKDDEDKIRLLTLLNAALSTAKYKNMPVHINCPSCIDYELTHELPEDVWKTTYYRSDFGKEKENLKNKNFIIFIGQHKKFSKNEQEIINNFVESWNIPVFCDCTSNYTGNNKVLISQYTHMQRYTKGIDLIIDIGNICGEYYYEYLYKGAEVWRITDDGEFKCRNSKPVTKTFYCEEGYFFNLMTNRENIPTKNFYSDIKNEIDTQIIPELPLCNALICQSLAKKLPLNSNLHLSILNSLRNMNFFNIDNSITTSCNVGGFGIDGAVSTLIGQSIAHPNEKYFGLIGDLAFFYDMNALGIRNISNNVRMIIINNSKGIEFRISELMEVYLHSKIDNLIAASGHNKGGAEGWAKSCGFHYMRAQTKEDFLAQINEFCNGDFDKPVLFEVFTTTEDEQQGLKLMKNCNRNSLQEGLINCYKKVKKIIN